MYASWENKMKQEMDNLQINPLQENPRHVFGPMLE